MHNFIKTLICEMRKNLYKSPQDDLIPLKSGVAIYARVANNQNNGLAMQIADVEKNAKQVGDVNCKIYSEVASGISRNRQERKELYRLMEDVKSGLIKRIYVKCRDRFARDIDFEIEIEGEVRKCGVELIEVL